MKHTISIGIVEDSEVFSQWLEEDLKVFDELEVTWRANSIEQANALILDQEPDAVILDLRLNEESGIELLKNLKERPNKPRVYVLTSYSLTYLRVKCLELGADGFYDKSSDYFQLIEDIRSYVKA